MPGRLLASIAVALTVLCCFDGKLLVKAGSNKNLEQDLLKLEQKWLDAEDDPSVLESILADDFIHVLAAGFVTKREQLDYLRTHPTARRERKHFEDLRMRIYGKAGLVNGTVVATGTEGDARRTLFTDVFVLRGGKWQAVNAQELPQPITKELGTGEKEEAVAEALIRQRVEDWAKVVRAKDIDGVMSLYAPNIVSFDINPPLRYAETDNKRRAWQEFFAAYTGPVAYEVRDLNVMTRGDLAFVYSLNHVNGTLASGHITDMWVRWTACFRRIHGGWLVVHDHVSVPAELEHGKAVLDLTP